MRLLSARVRDYRLQPLILALAFDHDSTVDCWPETKSGQEHHRRSPSTAPVLAGQRTWRAALLDAMKSDPFHGRIPSEFGLQLRR